MKVLQEKSKRDSKLKEFSTRTETERVRAFTPRWVWPQWGGRFVAGRRLGMAVLLVCAL